MVTTDLQEDERILWLKYVLNPDLPRPQIEDWRGLLEFAQKQAIVGVCSPIRFDNIFTILTEKEVLLEWIGYQSIITERNEVLNRQTVSLTEILREAGFRCCILKGQGNATMYPFSELRTPGDIDVWVDTDKETLLEYVRGRFPEEKESYKHIKFPVFSDTEVDMHYTPLKIYHPFHNKRLQQWIEENKENQMTHFVGLANIDAKVAIPTPEFNAVYQLGHILIHIEDEGIGLRQMVDYYYVLKQLGNVSCSVKRDIIDTWEQLGLKKLAGAVMWVEREMLGLAEEYLLVAPNEKMGRLLAEDILEGGNFGHYSNRQEYSRYGRFAKKIVNACHLLKLSVCFPEDAVFRLLTKLKNAPKILAKRKT